VSRSGTGDAVSGAGEARERVRGTAPSRRDVLRLAAGFAALPPAALLAGCEDGGGRGRRVDNGGRVSFARPLAIPPLAESDVDAEGVRRFALEARPGRRELLPGRAARTWGFNGDHLGPTLRMRRGEHVGVDVRNALDEPTTVHWHGAYLPAAADGGPHQVVEPGATWSPRWVVDQPAATLWYHPHPHGATERHTYRGLAGMLIVDDEPSAALGLPRAYGVDDVPVIVQDKRFDADGDLAEDDLTADDRGPVGLLGDTVLVNGTFAPYLEVRTRLVRLRLLNASTARTYAFGLSDGRPLALVGTDGGLLAAPLETDRVQLSPGERAEIVVAMAPGERAVLRSTPPDLGTVPGLTTAVGGDDTLDVLELRAAGSLDAPAGVSVPARLADVPSLAPDDAAATRSFRLAGMTINGRRLRMDRVDEVVPAGTTEVWEVVNRHALPHNFHVHGVQFQVLSLDGARVPAALAGWKDTVYVAPRTAVRIAVPFGDHTDPAVPYLYHCHLSFHEDVGMMGQFVVVGPGQQPAVVHGHHAG
jgi:FtsP/CotA-like multicopper oxidase with cupredoxin domain